MDINDAPQLDGANLALGLLVGVVTAVVFGGGGFLLAYNSQGYMGSVLFLLVPIATGFATALVARRRNVIIASLILGLLFCTAILLLTGFEGFVCVLMSAPLIAVGLPVPVSCKTEGEGVGGKRTCYFEHGFIEERVTEWDFPRSMKFDIVASEVPGRPWLSFRDAGYEIKRVDNHTLIIRNTTIVSRLSPAWYWKRLEAIGVHTEHEYLFEG